MELFSSLLACVIYTLSFSSLAIYRSHTLLQPISYVLRNRNLRDFILDMCLLHLYHSRFVQEQIVRYVIPSNSTILIISCSFRSLSYRCFLLRTRQCLIREMIFSRFYLDLNDKVGEKNTV